MIIKDILSFLRLFYDAAVKMIYDDGVEHAGYMSFTIILSIFPFFIYILAFTSFLGASEIGYNFIALILKKLPNNSVEGIKGHIEQILTTPPQSLLNLAIFGSIWTASSFVECLRTILNKIYCIKSLPNYWFRRLMSIIQFMAITLLISLIMFLFVFVPIILEKVPIFANLLRENTLSSLAIWGDIVVYSSLFLMSILLYKVVPNVKINIKDIVPGAIICVILWNGVGVLMSEYIKYYYNQFNLIYGSLGSIIITLLFFYIVNLIFIYCASLNYLFKYKRDKYIRLFKK